MSPPVGCGQSGRAAAAVVAAILSATLAGAQSKVLGPSGCVSCHDHARQAQKWQKEEPLQLKGKAHFNTRKQLEAPKSAAFAKAIGLADPYDLKGSCVQCHGTVFKGDVNAGVSCESCHGPASAYNEPHQAKGAYAKAVSLGLRDLRGKPAEIAKTCVDCHVTPDKRLGAAGHPLGEKFDAGVSLQKIVHWNAAYDFALVSATGRKLGAARLGSGGGKTASAAPPPATAAPVKPSTGGVGAAATAVPATAAATAKPAAAKPGAAASAAGDAEPWNWDLPVRALPEDYQPEAEAAPPAPTDAPAAERPRPRAPKAPAPVSIAYEAPLPPPIAQGDTGPLSAAVAPAVAATPEAAATPVPRVPTDLRGRALVLLTRTLRAGGRVPSLPPATKPREFSGPDGELMRLQDEAMALGIEALRGSAE